MSLGGIKRVNSEDQALWMDNDNDVMDMSADEMAYWEGKLSAEQEKWEQGRKERVDSGRLGHRPSDFYFGELNRCVDEIEEGNTF